MSETAASSCTSNGRVLESEYVTAVALAVSIVALARKIANQFLAPETNGADVMHRLPIRCGFFQFKHEIILLSFKKLIAGFFSLKLVLPVQLFAQFLERHAKLNIHHICCGQVRCQAVKQLLGFFTVRLGATINKALNTIDRISGFSGDTQSAGRKAKSLLKLIKVHTHVPLVFRLASLRIQPFMCAINLQERGA